MKIPGMSCVVAIILVPWLGYAQQQEASFDDWRVLTMQEKTGKVCYVTSVPVKKEGKVTKREQPYAMVTAWGKSATEVSVASGYPYKVDSTIELIVDNTAKYQLYSNKKILKVAWGSNPSEHQKIIERMLKGTQMVVKGTSKSGTSSQDSYSLKGFAKAYKAMKDLCSTASTTSPKASQEPAQKPAQKVLQKPTQEPSPKASQKPPRKP